MAKADDFFALFKDRLKLATEAVKDQVENELADQRFESGDHWDADVLAALKIEGRPAMVIDLLSGPIKQVTNQQRTARPGIVISPVGNGADKKMAQRWQGILRRAERLSSAGRIYAWAGQHQAVMGRGFWVVRNVEVGEDGEQDVRLEEVDNQHTVLVDPTTKKLNGEDKKWAIRWEDLTHEEYIARFGESKLADSLGQGFGGTDGDSPPEWVTTSHCRIAEYYYLEESKRTRLVGTQTTPEGERDWRAWEDELPSAPGRVKGKFATIPQIPEGVTVKRRVQRPKKTVHWCLLNGAGERLEETTIPGEYIPVVKIFGERRNIDGKVDERGMVRMAKHPSRMEDYCESSLMEAISEAKSAPWMAEWSQLEGFESMWNGTKRVRVLTYRKVSGDNGAPLPPPQRVNSGVDVTALTLAAQRMQNHVRHVLGNPDVFQEETRDEKSGVAIRARRQQMELGTSDYMEGLGDGIVLTAKIMMSMYREILDTPRVLRILGEDNQESEIVTHQGPDQRRDAEQLLSAEIKELFDVSVGEYDIAISPGRSYLTEHEENVDILTEVIPKLLPEMQARAIPILIENMPGAAMQKLAAALAPSKDGQPNPQQLQVQVQQADQLLQMAQQRIQELEQEKEADVVKSQAALQKAQMDNETKLAVAELGAKVDRLALFYEERARISGEQHETALAAADAAHEHEQNERQALQAMATLGATEKPANGNGGKAPKAGA